MLLRTFTDQFSDHNCPFTDQGLFTDDLIAITDLSTMHQLRTNNGLSTDHGLLKLSFAVNTDYFAVNTDYSRTTDTEFLLVRKSVNGP